MASVGGLCGRAVEGVMAVVGRVGVMMVTGASLEEGAGGHSGSNSSSRSCDGGPEGGGVGE